MKDTLDFILEGGSVKRYHTRSTITWQNNAEHSYGVASIVQLISPNCSKDLLLYALWHDVNESRTGDIPGPAKKRWPELKELLNKIEAEIEQEYPLLPKISAEERATLKMADCIETIMFCQREHKMGNRKLGTIIKSCKCNFLNIENKYPNQVAMELFCSITE